MDRTEASGVKSPEEDRAKIPSAPFNIFAYIFSIFQPIRDSFFFLFSKKSIS